MTCIYCMYILYVYVQWSTIQQMVFLVYSTYGHPSNNNGNPYERMMILPNHPRTVQFTHVLTAPAAWRVS